MKYVYATIFIFMMVLSVPVFAASPSGSDTFQLLVSPQTGSDNTGDGGTGNGSDLNYVYVGQQFSTQIQINSGGTTTSNIWIDYPSNSLEARYINAGTYYGVWSNLTIDPTETGLGGGRVFSTGSNFPVAESSGVGNFGTIGWEALEPNSTARLLGQPATIDVNIGNIGNTTESNISNAGVDILDDAEDFNLHIWADVVDPYATNPNPANNELNVAVESNYQFDLCDSKEGEAGDSGTCLSSGVGTGVSTATPPGFISVSNPIDGASDGTSYDSYSCSGVWGSNLCTSTLNPSSPVGIPSDSRNWHYDTTYTVNVGGFEDLASSDQDKFGDPNGPNTISGKTYTFTTEPDIVAPKVVSESPSRGGGSASIDTNIVINIEDRKTYSNGPSGSGVNVSTCSFNVSSPSFALTNYTSTSSEVSATVTDYGVNFTINPSFDFVENETVTVSAFDCFDEASTPNQMTVDTWSFSTGDTAAPYIFSRNPENNTQISDDGVVNIVLNDDGVGVDLSSVVVYLDGQYYSKDGGAGIVTTSGTRITYTDSLSFENINYIGDTTFVSGDSSSYDFTLDPMNDFIEGEPISIIVYARDFSGNIMERDVYSLVSSGDLIDGSVFCGSNTSWSGSVCEGSGGGGGTSIVTVTEEVVVEVEVPVYIEVPVVEEVVVEVPGEDTKEEVDVEDVGLVEEINEMVEDILENSINELFEDLTILRTPDGLLISGKASPGTIITVEVTRKQ